MLTKHYILNIIILCKGGKIKEQQGKIVKKRFVFISNIHNNKLV